MLTLRQSYIVNRRSFVMWWQKIICFKVMPCYVKQSAFNFLSRLTAHTACSLVLVMSTAGFIMWVAVLDMVDMVLTPVPRMPGTDGQFSLALIRNRVHLD